MTRDSYTDAAGCLWRWARGRWRKARRLRPIKPRRSKKGKLP